MRWVLLIVSILVWAVLIVRADEDCGARAGRLVVGILGWPVCVAPAPGEER